jgi:hypothetical protein
MRRCSIRRLMKKAHLRRRLSSEGGTPPFRTSPKFARAKLALEREMRLCPPAAYKSSEGGVPPSGL